MLIGPLAREHHREAMVGGAVAGRGEEVGRQPLDLVDAGARVTDLQFGDTDRGQSRIRRERAEVVAR